MRVSLRLATEHDAPFAFRCEKETMEEYAIATWGGPWPAEMVRTRSLENIRAGKTEIIERHGEPIGILRVVRSDEEWHLQQIFIMPAHQNLARTSHRFTRFRRGLFAPDAREAARRLDGVDSTASRGSRSEDPDS